ncbi:MAG TPA: TetR/AcrR family transcriptional regulator C-terminal domain-containing protein [Ktedonobacterales bacterium]|jgi:AcrR family transcriptional regulator
MKSPDVREDLRVRRTHKLLWEALLAELSERPFEDITVKDICERAMVHRTTFYKHYEDKYALLEQGMRQMYDALLAHDAHLPPSAYSVEHPPPYFVRLFEHAAQYQQFYRLMLCGEGIGRFQKLVKDYIVDIATGNGRESASGAHAATRTSAIPAAIAAEMHAHVVAGAALSLVGWWLEHDMPLTPRQMAQYLLAPHGDVPVARR